MHYPRGAAGTDLLFFILFIIALGVVWALTGGPERSISREGPFLTPPFPLGSESGYFLPSVPIPSHEATEKRSEGEAFSDILTSLRARLSGGTEEKRSPYADAVSLSISNARTSEAAEEYVTIKTSKSAGTLTISGWRLESSITTLGATLGPAAYLPYSGRVNTELPVALGPNSTVYITTGRSPIGTSFRTNLCTGYFSQFQSFEPRLKAECPAPENELSAILATDSGLIPNETCIDFVSGIRECTLTTTPIPGAVGSQCSDFVLETLSYAGCVDLHKNDPGFYKNEWRIYLDRDQELWGNTHERIRLLDENGSVIDAVSY